MLKLKKLYSHLSRNAVYNLIDPKRKEVYFSGEVSDIPDSLDDYEVCDILEYSSYEYAIIIKKPKAAKRSK